MLKKVLTIAVSTFLVFTSMPKLAWSQEMSGTLTPTPKETVEQLKSIKQSRLATGAWSGLFAIVSGAAGTAFSLSRSSTEKLYQARKAEYTDVITAKKSVIDRVKDAYNGEIQGTGKSKESPLLVYDRDKVTVELERSWRDNKRIVLGNRFKVSLKGEKIAYFNASEAQVWAFERTAPSEFELQNMLKRANKQKIAGVAFWAIAGVSLIYSVYNLISAAEIQTSETAVNMQSIKTLLAHDYSKPLPPNLVMLLNDDKLRDSIYSMDIIRKEAEKNLL
ncbi:MAG: hypothetical protein V1647_04635 [Pseudomonadota bacterium]